jgi:peptide/nickel transport system substrate-binding protein
MGPEGNYWTRLESRRSDRRRLLRGLGLSGAGLAGVALVGCGSNGNNKPAAATSAATKAAAAAPSGAASAGAANSSGQQPVFGGTLIGLQTRDAASLDPLASQVYTTPERIGLAYPRLLYYDRDEKADFADTHQVPSYMTDKWEFSGDGSQLTFHLRAGVKYSNTAPVNGRELVAEDVKFSINRYMTDPTSAFKARYSDIDSIQTPDQHTAVFKLKGPSAYVLYALAAEPSLITPPEIAQAQGDYKQLVVGPGPFLHEKTTQGEGSSFKKNPDFIDAAKVYYDRIQIKVIVDSSTRSAAIRTGQADFVTGGAGVPKSEAQALTQGNSAVKSYLAPALLNYGFWFNMNNPKWKDLRARKAVSKAINRQDIIDKLMESDGVFGGPIPAGFGKWAYSDEQMRQFDAYKYDPTAAKQLWAAAGMPATSSQQLYIPPKQEEPLRSAIGELIGQQLKTNLGIESEFSTDERSAFVNKVYNNKFPDVAVFGMGLFDPLDYLLAQYYPGGARNGPGLNDPRLTAMLDDLRGTLDDAARVKKGLDVQKLINDEILSMAHVPVPKNYDVYSSKLQHFLPAVRPPGIEWALSSWKSK